MVLTIGECAEAWTAQTALAFLEQCRATEAARRHFWVLADEHVHKMWWLSQYLRVWLLQGTGVGYCRHPAIEDPYEFCLNVLTEATQYNYGDQCISRFPSLWHDCGGHGSKAPPVLTRAEFEQIVDADQAERDRLLAAFTVALQRPEG